MPVESQGDAAAARRISKQIDQAFEEVARLSGGGLPPSQFYEEFLAKVMGGVGAPAGAVWLRTPQGFLQLQCQFNVEHVGLDQQRGGRQLHNELLRQAFQTAKPMLLDPFQNTGIGDGGAAGNPTGYVCLLAPVMADEKTAVGLVELWQEPRWDARAQRTFLNYLVQMAGYAGNFARNLQARHVSGQEQVWQQLEAFARAAHSSLNPTEVAYTIANEGRRLIGCDRLSVAVRHERKAVVEAVSGADVVEKRSALMKLMRKLLDTVIEWGERLTYRGTKDETLPPKVLAALDGFLAESNCKVLVVDPLLDERDKVKEGERGKPKKARSCLVMECFESPESVDQTLAKLDVVGRHAAPALYNAAEMKRVPLRWAWWPIMKVQAGLGGKTKAIVIGVTLAIVALAAAMVLVPYPLKLEANGQLLPKERRVIYSSRDAKVLGFNVEPGDDVQPDAPLVRLFDPTLQQKLGELSKSIQASQSTIQSKSIQQKDPATNAAERLRLGGEIDKERITVAALQNQMRELTALNHCDANQHGAFFAVAPPFSLADKVDRRPLWTVLNSDFKEQLINRPVKMSDPLLRLGNKTGAWEVELKIPQKHIGQVLAAFGNQDELTVDLLPKHIETQTYKGKLSRRSIAGEAVPNRDDHNESEPIVLAYVRISGDDLEKEGAVIPRDQLVTGVEVHAKVRCGDHPMGYSLFYGVWEFIYAKVIFFLF